MLGTLKCAQYGLLAAELPDLALLLVSNVVYGDVELCQGPTVMWVAFGWHLGGIFGCHWVSKYRN